MGLGFGLGIGIGFLTLTLTLALTSRRLPQRAAIAGCMLALVRRQKPTSADRPASRPLLTPPSAWRWGPASSAAWSVGGGAPASRPLLTAPSAWSVGGGVPAL